ncbi:uncharacterized protein LOC118741815 [Rhagoletis pomonella]|uniref:uncharacterized protein LOC118741815 n=1 Tax=Rhagoletis pomonella TaxID=28610 RepID=UPI00177B5BFB|nr:uncharacterized protein LOC118741815 [Rhagoletis pomonella]
MVQTTNRHTAANLKEEILKCLEEYNIRINQIYSYTTDNAASVLKLSRLLQGVHHDIIDNEMVDIDVAECNLVESNVASVFSVVRCVAHAIQLAADDVIKTLENDIEECRIIAKKVRTLVTSENDEIRLPCLDVITRWNSTYNMICEILSLKEFIENLDNYNSFDINWIFIQNFVMAFAPLAKCTLKLQKEQYILGDFLRDWLACELELEELASLNQYALALLNAMRNIKDILLKHDAFAAAIYLDPRYNINGTPFLTEDCKKRAMDHLLKVYEMVKHLESDSYEQEFIKCSNSSSSSSQDDIPTSSASAYDKLDLHVQNLMNTQKLSSQGLAASTKLKLMRRCEGERLSFGTNILEYTAAEEIFFELCLRNVTASSVATLG